MCLKVLKSTLVVFYVISTASMAEGISLGKVVVTATAVGKDTDEIPAAISTIAQDEIQLGAEQLGLDESLGRVPGLFMMNRYNFAQDLRISIRGFGARSSFGVRGIKIIVDGIPETLPDGQGSIDGIDIGSASQVTVIRSPASSLYGNAAGGAILIESERGPEIPFIEARTTVGDFDFKKWQLKAGGDSGKFNYFMNLSKTSLDGYREHSEFENTQLNARFEIALSASSSLQTTIHHTDQPVANDSGSTTEVDAAINPDQAREQNVIFNAGEELQQTRLGLLYKTHFSEGRDFEVRIYNTDRDFNNKLPFQNGGVVFLNRSFVGGGIKYTFEDKWGGKFNRLLIGLDYDRQDDDRSRFDNLLGIIGEQTFKQNELVTGIGAYFQNQTRLTDNVELTVGMRYDDVKFDVSDQFLSDGNDSGKVNLYQVSPMVGISFKRSDDTYLYATISKAFETPTTTEFANPAGGGFNQALEPQDSINYEVGFKKLMVNHRYEVALFHIDVENELTPFELSGQPGRTFFENAGSSSRDGLELSYTRQLVESVNFSMAYTYSYFVFERFMNVNGDVFDGNRIPGIPQNLLYFDLSWTGNSGIYASWDTTYSDGLYADNANQTKIGSSHVSNIRLGSNYYDGDWEFASFLGVNNLFDEHYYNNIRINAFGSRYFEPAPVRNIYFGISMRWNFYG